jgi:hypothetical protein
MRRTWLKSILGMGTDTMGGSKSYHVDGEGLDGGMPRRQPPTTRLRLRSKTEAATKAAEPEHNLWSMSNKFTNDERDQIIQGWYQARHTQNQAEYCAEVSTSMGQIVSPRTLRSWIGGVHLDPGDDRVDLLRREAYKTMKQLQAYLAALPPLGGYPNPSGHRAAVSIMKHHARGQQSVVASAMSSIEKREAAAGVAEPKLAAAEERARARAAGSRAGKEERKKSFIELLADEIEE